MYIYHNRKRASVRKSNEYHTKQYDARKKKSGLQFQHKYQRLQKAVTSAEDGGIASAATTVSPTHKRQDLTSQSANKDKKNCKGQRG